MGKFYPYGLERPSATTNGTEKFTGYFRDSETGLDYAINRYASPGTGRFLTPDHMAGALTDPRSWNLYTKGDSINRVDPFGRDDCDPNTCVTVSASFEPVPFDPTGSLTFEDFVIGTPYDASYSSLPFFDPGPNQNTWTPGCGWVSGNGAINPACMSQNYVSVLQQAAPTTPPAQQPQAQTSQRPRREPCTPLAGNLSGPAKGLDTLVDAFSRVTHPVDMIAVFFAAGSHMVAGVAVAAAGCLEPTPFEPLTCLAGGTAGTASIASGAAIGAFGVYFFKRYTLPAIKDWGCHE